MGDAKIDSVMILFMGKTSTHAHPSFQKYIPDAVHIVTSEDFRRKYVRSLNEWSKKYGFRKGSVRSISDLFENTSVDSLLKCVFDIVEQETNVDEKSEEEEGGPVWSIGLTGGTMHMAAAATLAGTILNARLFYVIKPKIGEKIMANKHVLDFPSLLSMNMAMNIRRNDMMFLMENKKGTSEEYEESCNIPFPIFQFMETMGLVDIEPEGWQLTNLGVRCFQMVLSSEILRDLLKNQSYLASRLNPEGDGNSYMWM